MEMIQTPEINLSAICHILTLCVTGLLILVLDLFINDQKLLPFKIDKKLLPYVALGGVILAGISSMNDFGPAVYAFNNTIAADNFAAFFNVIFCDFDGFVSTISTQF